MEGKLAEYRARKRMATVKQSLYNMVTLSSQQHDGNISNSSFISHTTDDAESIESNSREDEITSPKLTPFTVTMYTLYILLWATVYAIAIHLEFGTVYLIVSILYAIWKNTRTGPKKQGEISAYSVFNPNCEAIDGTLKAEQFEQEIRYGAGAVH
ncbi:SAYSvFN domain-containing protein 1 isoform X2 [Zootermopsis nevadensis]|uniref:SAYSvFN domain-containing protein n=1 Tax=Zootermopsis nevadensis TaxID=136037 RepID=A0A067RDX9_ZOONE|nr:SAYSvFN domain-containing protein 1 isoform X2 [Zootermopsis nevadensis]KDR22066.1 hypothetical protein L798_02550 [Zootermopsis nevadensis]